MAYIPPNESKKIHTDYTSQETTETKKSTPLTPEESKLGGVANQRFSTEVAPTQPKTSLQGKSVSELKHDVGIIQRIINFITNFCSDLENKIKEHFKGDTRKNEGDFLLGLPPRGAFFIKQGQNIGEALQERDLYMRQEGYIWLDDRVQVRIEKEIGNFYEKIGTISLKEIKKNPEAFFENFTKAIDDIFKFNHELDVNYNGEHFEDYQNQLKSAVESEIKSLKAVLGKSEKLLAKLNAAMDNLQQNQKS